ncbi:UNVERIFIED_CONTAM: Pentatricopeptide repeat-containing protein [Sesamum latifolium]|uniref:Pentatricopeptide repeat-containing protein n=1 Tax=Sesamum latifolium TaxID=2727402 RepID=A0AAW2VTK2_9LAMI
MQDEIVNALHLGERSRASHLLSELGREGQALQAADFISILQYCARTPDPSFVMETWKLMEEKGVELNGKCYFLTIRALCKGGYLKEAFNFLSVRTEKLRHLSYIAVLRQDLSAVRDIWKEYINCHTLGIITLRKFIWSFTRLRDLDSAYVALQQMIAMALQQKFRITENAEGRLSDLMLDIPIPCRNELTLNGYAKNNCTAISSVAGYCDEKYSIKGFKFGMEAKKVEAEGFSSSKQPISGPVVKLLRGSFGDLIHTCANSQNVVLAEQLMLQMQNLGLEPSCSTYNGFIRALVSVKGFHDGMEVLKVMEQKNMKLHDSTLAALSVSCSRGLELDLAETFLSQISKCRHTYPSMHSLKHDKPERAVRVLAKMNTSEDLWPDIRTYERLFSLFGNGTNVHPKNDGQEIMNISQ